MEGLKPTASVSFRRHLDLTPLGELRWLEFASVRPLSTRGSKLMVSSSHWYSSRLVKGLLAVGLAVLGVVLVWTALPRSTGPDSALAGAPDEPSVSSTTPGAPTPTPRRSTARAHQGDVRDKVKGLVLPESEPVSVSIPRIGVRSTLDEVRLKRDGEMETPVPVSVAGWYTRGATPGALGPAVITGHVTWDGAPSVFYRLGTLRRGDQVSVARKDGRTAVFTVTRVARFSKSHFPSRAVYGAIDHAGLRLITCGGTYDTASHRYLDNVVVFARLHSVRGPGG